MNKRFSTIVAAAILLSSGSVFAQTTTLPRFDTKPAEKMAEVNGDSYIHIGGTVTEDGKDVNYVLAFAKDDKGTYLITRKIAVAIKADPEVHPMSIDSALWLPTVTVVDGIKGYQFTNKLNPDLKLAVKYDSKAAKAYLVDPETEGAFSRFAWNPSSSDSLLCAYDDNKVRYAFDMKAVAADKTENVKFVKISGDAAKYSGAVAIAPEQTLLNAQDLNKINSNCFDLRVNDEVTNNSADDLNANSYIAYDAKVGGTLVGGVYLQAKGKSVDSHDIKDSKGNPMPNKHIFLVVDTVFSAGASIKNPETGRGLVITTDTIVCNWNPGGDPAKPEDWTLVAGPKPGTDPYLCLDKDSVAQGRAAAHYRFYIYKNHAAVNGEGLVVKVDSIPQLYDGLNNYAGTLAQARTETAAKQDSIGFFAIDRVGDVKNPGLFTVIDSTALSTQNVSTLATVGFSAGSLAKLEKGVYSIKALEDKSVAAKGKYLIANSFNTDEAGDRADWTWFVSNATASNELVLAGQFYIDGVNGRFTIENRENGQNPFGGAQYINTTATADQYIIGGKKYEIKQLDVDMTDPYVGYKHLTSDESSNFAAKLKFNAPYAGENLYIVVAEDGKLNVEKDAADRALQFKLVSAGDAKYGVTAAVKGKIDDGKMKRNAYRLVNAADETQVVVLDGENFVLKSIGADEQKADGFVGTLAQYKDSVAVPFLFRAIEEANGYELYVADTTLTASYNRSGASVPVPVYGTDKAFSGYRVDSLASYKLNVQGTSAYLMSTTLNTAGSGYFTLELPEEAAFVNVTNSKPAHHIIASKENPTLAISIDAKNNAVLKAESELKADAFSDNFKLFVDTACLEKPEKPLFYIWTTQNVAAENVEKGIGNYLYAENGAGVPTFVLAAQTGDNKDKMDIFNSKGIRVEKDVKVTDSRAAWAFASTTEKGVYKVQNNKSGKYLAQKNGVLSLTTTNNPFDGLAVTLTESEIPTGNETIEANTISVVAGEGNVTVYGAAGKTIIVSDVVGHNTTVVATSDAETIPATSGVVIVKVDSEVVKTVVK
ncbi:DUF6383 domain-containing protein [Parabacteroides bouchesdurhonensis]|uniref:DUF6383 domain-containing protein n=1 Tax=Parabacteroides bouchesdurhonensis TaxID=1936995 RepID=UPI000E520361|nr:DUF6383 domain-containing protein [Parabacteroides bouchesdurhonensis]RHJ88960.1 hypothetical protein DW095_14150 [Bacteroides sp. AM07-16]